MSNAPERPQNPPGLTALAYRLGDYTQVKQRALESLYIPVPPATSTLSALRTRDVDDVSIALIDAWAMVIDVLTFYQERIANEGYWYTATERRSLLELARTIGCELQPGVAASTYLMFTVESTPTAPRQVTVPKGTQIASIPGENEKSQTFETQEPLIARVDWNALKPRLTRPQTLTPQTQQVVLQGINTQLQVGDRLLLIDEPTPGESPTSPGDLLTLTEVELLTASGQTRIAWDKPLTTVPRHPRFLAFRQQVALFGNGAPKWDTLPAEMKQRYSPVKGGSFRLTGQEWRSVTMGLPSLDVRCLAVQPSQGLFVGTLGGGIFRSLDRGESWQSMTIGLSNLAIETLYCSEQGQIFAGTPGGGVFRSRDKGETWTAIHSGTVRVQATGPDSWESVNTALPNTVVRCLLAYKVPTVLGSGTITSGSPQVASSSEPSTRDTKTISGQQTQFRAELRIGESITVGSQTHQVTAITSNTELKTDAEWNPSFENLPFFISAEQDFLFVGTDDGVYRSADQGQNWYSKGLTTQSVRALLALMHPERKQGRLQSVPKDSENQNLANLQVDETDFKNIHEGQRIRINQNEHTIIAIDKQKKIFTVYPPLKAALNEATEFDLLASRYLYAATEEGVYCSANHGDRWQLIPDSPKNATCLALLLQQNEAPTNYLFVGTSDGIYRYNYTSNTWEPKAAVLAQPDITALTAQSTQLYAGTGSGKIFVSDNTGNTWQECTPTPIAAGVTALAASQNDLFVGTRFTGFVHADWSPSGQPVTSLTPSNLPPTATSLDLNALYPQILPHSWIALLNQQQVQLLQVQTVTTTLATGFTLSAQVTRVTFQPSIDPSLYHPQTTIVLAQSESLTLAPASLTLESQQRQMSEVKEPAIAVTPLQPDGSTPLEGQQRDPAMVSNLDAVPRVPFQVAFFDDPIGRDRIFLNQFVQGLQSGQTLIVAGKRPRLEIRQVGGVFSRKELTEDWQHDNQGLSNLAVLSLLTTPQGDILAGTAKGLFRRQKESLRWEAIATISQAGSEALTAHSIYVLHKTASDVLFAGTESGLLRSQNNGFTWTALNQTANQTINQTINQTTKNTAVRALVSAPHSNSNAESLYLATEDGLFRSTNQGDDWVAINRGSLAIQVQSLAVNAQSDIFTGTREHGVFRSTDQGNSWTQIGYSGKPGTGAISSIGRTVTGIGTLFSDEVKPGDLLIALGQTRSVTSLDSTQLNNRLTINEPFASPGLPAGTPFMLSTGLTNLNVTALATYNQPRTGETSLDQDNSKRMVFAGTAGGGVFRSANNGESWQAINHNLPDLNITVLAAYEHPGSARLEITGTTIAAYPSIPLPVDALITIANQTRRVTAILSESSSKITFSINAAFDNLPQPLPPYTVQVLVVGTESGGVFYSLDRGDHWLASNAGLTNTAVRAIAPPHPASDSCFIAGTGILLSADRLESVPLAPGDSLQVLAAPTVLRSPHVLQWHLRDVNGFEGILTSTTTVDVTLHPALDTDGEISELVTLLAPPTDQQTPVLVFQEPLQSCYDPASVTVHANVVAATHGETIAEQPEVLGSGDGTLANQRFFLKKPPLTYISAATETGITSSLEVRVNDLLWKPVPALYGLQPTDQVYLVQIDDEGNTSITFGDGLNGARLPSGVDNVVATYRSGIGEVGNLAAGKLSLLKTRPLGIQSVTNPLPATGAADPERRDDIRKRAPLTVRTLDRVVSLQDVEDYARTFPGIGKAMAVPLWTAHAPVIHLTIAGSDGAEIPPNTALYQNLVQAISRVHDPYQSPPVIESYQRIWFEVSATLLIDPRYQADPVQTAVQAKLQRAFAFAHREFGQPVTAAEVIALMQAVEGVTAVDLDFLHRINAPKTLEQCLTANLAQWNPDTQQFTPAQLLLLRRSSVALRFPSP